VKRTGDNSSCIRAPLRATLDFARFSYFWRFS
jgi:hypothetical protein